MTLFLLSALNLGAQIPDAELDKISRADIVKTLQHQQQNIQELQKRATEAETHEIETRNSLQTMQRQDAVLRASLAAVSESAKLVEAERDQAVADKIEEHKERLKEKDRADKAEKREAEQRGLAWKWRLMFFGLVAAVVALFIFKEWLKTIPIIGPIIASIL